MAKKTAKIPLKTKEVKVIPDDLRLQMKSVEACATAFGLIEKGTYPYTHLEAVRASLAFLAKLHEQSMEQALRHPQAHMLDELKEHLKTAKAKVTKEKDEHVEAETAEH